MTASVFDHPILAGLLGDEEVSSYFTAAAELEALLAFETALAEAEAEEGIITQAAAAAIRERARDFTPDLADLKSGTARDGVVVPALLRQLRQGLGPEAAAALHHGATSQDAIDAAMAMRLMGVSLVIDRRLARLGDRLAQWGIEAGDAEVMAHTRMQAARPTRFRRKLSSWADPLVRCRLRREELTLRAFVLRFGGAVGDRSELGHQADAVADRVAASLGLFPAPGSLHSERDGIVEIGHWLSLVTGALGKFGQDAALALQSEVGELRLEGGGSSSAMAHKQNPVGAEMLVTLARFNATLVSGLHHSLVHENERSGAAWTLEWMLLPQMAMAAGAATRIAEELLENLSLAKS
ncbi:3-carboxy-cis,cis-muconate cycloisomerase [Aurantimonas aggregata]|uniref:3-carboxy-cis,cis-muconate cycloisomerase n=1 Tax=Aurantimonas aggregata TaxID=2047720 RepID=A0A6L9MDT9_9HYPH|nr:3-carboxy-cis,cis-muconate cycloisomerase [Aurantimonas aggregata]NDV85821.1 3-carboxy-cis,cis-muconate cycloisomerase [Aurantimonas aggregata]